MKAAGRIKSGPRRRRRKTIASKRSRVKVDLVEQDPGLLVVAPRAARFGAQKHRRLVTGTPGGSRAVERMREQISAGKPVSLVALVRRK